jgi:hypothetical protein
MEGGVLVLATFKGALALSVRVGLIATFRGIQRNKKVVNPTEEQP